MRDRREWKKKYYQKNKEREDKYHKQWAIENKEHLKEYNEQWRKDNPTYAREYYQKHKTYLAKYQNTLVNNNREHYREYGRKWQKTDKGKANDQRKGFRRRVKKNRVNTLTIEEWENILEAHNYRCAYCGVEFDCELLPEKDHVIPISKGGHNTKENVVPACKSCNCKKHDKLLDDDYKRSILRLHMR